MANLKNTMSPINAWSILTSHVAPHQEHGRSDAEDYRPQGNEEEGFQDRVDIVVQGHGGPGRSSVAMAVGEGEASHAWAVAGVLRELSGIVGILVGKGNSNGTSYRTNLTLQAPTPVTKRQQPYYAPPLGQSSFHPQGIEILHVCLQPPFV